MAFSLLDKDRSCKRFYSTRNQIHFKGKLRSQLYQASDTRGGGGRPTPSKSLKANIFKKIYNNQRIFAKPTIPNKGKAVCLIIYFNMGILMGNYYKK